VTTVATQSLSYRTIDLRIDESLVVAHQLDACTCSFGNASRFQGASRYFGWLESKLEEFPDGFLMAFMGDKCVGQIELEVPYGLSAGYANLFYVTPEFRRMGFGRLLHNRAEMYFRSWEATRINLHCSPTNERALIFYKRLGYRRAGNLRDRTLWAMSKEI
jgi:ribosomal protein S18 acetylase RimI-like enzyme